MVVGLNESIPDQMEQAMVLRTLRPRNLLDAYREGKRSLQLEYRRVLPTEENIWVLTTINLMKDPFSDDILSFIFIQNITHEKTMTALIESVVRVDYDFLLYIDLEKDTAQRFGAREPFDRLIAQQMVPFGAAQDEYIQQMILKEDRERCKQELSLASICEHLQSSEVYSVLAQMQIGNGPLLRKQFHMFYPEGNLGRYVILTCSDVTNIYEEEQNKTALLRDALKSAEQASVAKSEFLSRMSHEIRTPMNAIIGMSTLAAQAVHDPRHVADCLSKVGLSARFLLSLINDILDMSRIESGNVVLKKDTFPFAEFINGISMMIHSQAEAKGIDYDAIVIGFTDDVYIGDALKLQQVLVNILSNAVKFTPAGGKVQFHIQEVSRHGSDATMRFTVNDTGEGISEEFLPKIFDPFAQGGGQVNHTGTGLGLAISKNFVDLMGGTISVQSILGIGTEFNIVVPLAVSEESRIRASQKAELNLRELKTLIVDDDVVVCEHTRLILEELGASAEWVDSGFKAVTLVDKKWKIGQFYNIILVDWKMPNMDGIETTRKIRKIVGPDVTIIIMTAYDWQNIEQEARQAGVNMFINKPMFKASLCSAFERIWGEKQQSSTISEPHTFDFSGKRVLLVEDHILNVEVAKKLLQCRNMAVDVATNGLKAIESFMVNPAGYYDAILMDVRMPVMDGLMAARNIRLLDKSDSKTIPIIAMTANAFEEDIEKSRASGMDAHLAKPIDADVLYQTLNNFISR